MQITILRLGHRIFRDQRITTHCGLTARAFDASDMTYCGEKDEKMEDSIKKVANAWGDVFEVKYEKNWKQFIKESKNHGKTIVLLTMYGIDSHSIINELRSKEQLIVVIGSEKVPSDIYSFVDYQVAITNQPISEVSALGIFLDRFFENKPDKKFENSKIKVVPQLRGKKTSNQS
ncbi:MAG: tRNA (cytidine(56)-2'-O)-methyltransferase [Candidatus Aenigmarchaeota archaeon]|nr:tRNA (cytidine(56)-2'-O)-methyltransferase [Candidatus Aenigmarchaeota archaeon]